MAFKQPRVPEYREREGADRYIRSLVLFLKDFCMDVWTANNQRTGEIDAVRGGLSEMHYPVNSVCGKTGDVTLTAGDVGARPGSWMPTASDVGALAQGGTAADSSKLGGKTIAEIMLTLYPVGAVYISAVSTSPASLFGGTWEQLQDRFLLGAGSNYTAGVTGGTSKNVLNNTSIPHIGTGIKYVGSGGSFSLPSGVTYSEEWLGGGTTTNLDNMPPYLAVYMWKRVS